MTKVSRPWIPSEGAAEIHVSDVMSFLNCRHAWDLQSRLRQNLERVRPYSAFFLGRAVHDITEKVYAGIADDSNWRDRLADFVQEETTEMQKRLQLWDEEKRMIQENTDLADGMLEHYFAWERRQQGPYSMKNLEFVTLEQNFQIPIMAPDTGRPVDWAFFAGRWDGLIRRKDNGWLFNWELKTARSPDQRAETLKNDLQCTYYQIVGKLLFGEDFKGSIYTILGKKEAKMPTRLSKGGLSRSLTHQTLDTYLMGIKREHPDWDNEQINDEYGDVLAALYEQESYGKNPYFQRHVVSRNEHALEWGRQHLYDVAHDMVHDPAIYYNPGTQCNYCLVQEPCIARQNNTGFEIILETEYTQRGRASDALVDIVEV
jgi:hypothetical protein